MSYSPKVRAMIALSERFAAKVPATGNNSQWIQMNGQISRLTEGAVALHSLHSLRNPSDTDASHFKRVALAAARFNKEGTATINRLRQIYDIGAADIEHRMNAKLNLRAELRYEGEIRAVYRGMPLEERGKLLLQLIEENRGPEFAAIIKAPTTLTGMSEDHRQRYEDSFASKHAPEELAEAEALAQGFNDALVSTTTAGALAAEYSNPAKLAEITRAEAAAEAAASAFNASVSA